MRHVPAPSYCPKSPPVISPAPAGLFYACDLCPSPARQPLAAPPLHVDPCPLHTPLPSHRRSIQRSPAPHMPQDSPSLPRHAALRAWGRLPYCPAPQRSVQRSVGPMDAVPSTEPEANGVPSTEPECAEGCAEPRAWSRSLPRSWAGGGVGLGT